MANFIIQFPLKTEKYQGDILNKRFEISRKMYNSLVNITQKRYKEMVKIKEYRPADFAGRECESREPRSSGARVRVSGNGKRDVLVMSASRFFCREAGCLIFVCADPS